MAKPMMFMDFDEYNLMSTQLSAFAEQDRDVTKYKIIVASLIRNKGDIEKVNEELKLSGVSFSIHSYAPESEFTALKDVEIIDK